MNIVFHMSKYTFPTWFYFHIKIVLVNSQLHVKSCNVWFIHEEKKMSCAIFCFHMWQSQTHMKVYNPHKKCWYVHSYLKKYVQSSFFFSYSKFSSHVKISICMWKCGSHIWRSTFHMILCATICFHLWKLLSTCNKKQVTDTHIFYMQFTQFEWKLQNVTFFIQMWKISSS